MKHSYTQLGKYTCHGPRLSEPPPSTEHWRVAIFSRWRRSNAALPLVLLLLSLVAVRAAEDFCPDCEVPDIARDHDNVLLQLTPKQKKTAESRHVAYGLPTNATAHAHEHLLHQKDYLTWYDDDLRVPLWVAYRMTKKNITGVVDRQDCFRPDPRLGTNASATCADYNQNEKIFDQGHLAPNADFLASESMMVNTYIYSNITPQQEWFNEHTWSSLEGLVRQWCKKRGDLYVITGAVFDKNGDKKRDADSAAERIAPNHRVARPTAFYKIIIQKNTFSADDAIAILFPHENTHHTGKAWIPYVTGQIITIAEIEKMTGISFLPALSAAKRTAMENFKAPALWAKE